MLPAKVGRRYPGFLLAQVATICSSVNLERFISPVLSKGRTPSQTG